MPFRPFPQYPILSAMLAFAYETIGSAGAYLERDVALGGTRFVPRPISCDAMPSDLEACVHELGHADEADHGGLTIARIVALHDGDSLARILVHHPGERPQVGCAPEVFESWYHFVRMLIAGPAAQARLRIEMRGETATIDSIWHELHGIPGCENDMALAREITKALSCDAGRADALLHSLGQATVARIATDADAWRAIQIGARLLRERRDLRGRDVHWIIGCARAGHTFEAIRDQLVRRGARRRRGRRSVTAMSPRLAWLTLGVGNRRR